MGPGDVTSEANDIQSMSLARSAVALVTAMVGRLFVAVVPASAARIENPVAVFSGIDKITGRITTFDVYVGETVQFGALQVTPRVCYSRDETEAPKTTTFVEVDEITLDRKIRRLFTGWMFADSPGLNAVDHAVYDVWLKDCKQQSDVPRAGRDQLSLIMISDPRCCRARSDWARRSHAMRESGASSVLLVRCSSQCYPGIIAMPPVLPAP
jgi:hypothetical protein